ncbi:MAG: hypothetical protein ACT4OX_09615 [Actinomycetota bacterium]
MSMPADEMPRVTPTLLRKADAMCRRRLHHEHTGDKRRANKAADGRFAVSNRLVNDARLAHAEMGPPRADAFVEPVELEPEQRRLYQAAAVGYLAHFGAHPGRAADLGWRVALPEVGIDLVGDAGLAIDTPDGAKELRMLSLSSRRRALLDDVDVKVALLRTAVWAPDDLRIVAVDLIEDHSIELTPDVAADRAEARTWLAERVEAIGQYAADGRARAGADCSWCPFIAGCEAHR